MGAREELAAIRERAEAALRSDDWADSNREREALSDAVYGSLELVEALEAVLEVLAVPRSTLGIDPDDDAYEAGAHAVQSAIRTAIEAALTTDTKGEPR